MPKLPKKILVIVLNKLDLASAIAVRLTKYTGKSKEFIHPKHLLSQKPWFTRYLGINDVVLDLGSGNGQNSIKAAKIANKVIGIEIDEDLLKIAQSIKKQKKVKNVEFTQGNLEDKLPYKNITFDKILFIDVLEHLNNRAQILNEVYRVLKPKGLIMIGVPNKETSWKKTQMSVGICSYSDPDHKIEFNESSIRELLSKHEFEIIQIGYDKYDTPFRGFYDVIGSLYLPLYKKISNWRKTKAQKNPQEASGFEIIAQKK